MPGSVAGDDADVVRKMRLGTLNAGLLSSSGLADIDRAVFALQVPMVYTDYDEFDAVLARLSPTLAEASRRQGVRPSRLGRRRLGAASSPGIRWRPLTTSRAQKLFAWAGDTEAVEIWKAAGFNPVPLPSTEISTALQTGLDQRPADHAAGRAAAAAGSTTRRT